MKLLIESGGTKTDWVLFSDKAVDDSVSNGFNPMYDDQIDFPGSQFFGSYDIEFVHFYGAGVVHSNQRQQIQSQISQRFPKAKVEIASDVMGACRAVFGQAEGFLGLLGTGSGLVYFNGKEPEALVPSLGYLLGDEGSGMYIGRILIRDFIRGYMPKEIASSIMKEYNSEELKTRLYQEKRIASFMASFVKYTVQFRSHPYISQLIHDAFNSYFETFVSKSRRVVNQVSFVGSIAAIFQKELTTAAMSHGIEIGKVLGSPKEELLNYHIHCG